VRGDRSWSAEPSDATVIAASVARPELFSRIFDRHFAVVHAYLTRRIGRMMADDLASGTFTVAFERRGSFRADADSARPWLLGIASNLMRNQGRAEQRAMAAALSRLSSDVAAVTHRELDADAETLGGEVLAKVLGELDHGQRDALLLYAWEGLSYEEIAAALEVAVGTVRSRLARARERMRIALAVAAVNLRAAPEGQEMIE
jgi:RNA polymerase sigma factor (sigma-70 family)